MNISIRFSFCLKQNFIKVQIETKNISDNMLQQKKLEHKGDAQIHFKN